MANDSCDGLSVTVWTGDRGRGEQLARRLEVGAVNTNDAYANLFSGTLPHGGWKESGIGARFGGAQGIRKYTRQQAITAPRVPTMKREPMWYPYTPARTRLVAGAMRAVVARDNRRRLTRRQHHG